ncbi:MAG: cadmium-translocating P-type ATPase [Lachnospiraceae bacterium]|nr:cadmium-translocating P-type ATPase [Lachnospiraceae bacterium]
MKKKQKKVLIRIIIAAVLMIALRIAYVFLGENPLDENGLPIRSFVIKEPFWFIVYMVPYGIIGYDILKKAFKGIIKGQVFDENFLMAVATIGAIVVALIQKNGDYTEAIAVMLFYQIGELFQSIAVGKSRKNISNLMDIRPDYANIEENGELTQVDPSEVTVGTVIVVQPGEKIPIDGIVTEGISSLNTVALTGESLPRDVQAGDEVISGSINLSSVIKIRTTKDFGESTVSKILELVENASSRKSKSEEFISKFARIYTPAVCYSALALAILPALVQILVFRQPLSVWPTWIYRALTFLVISCPCALVISIPLSFFAGIGGAGKEGILIKGSNYLETLSKVKTVVFDKTGTLTKGVFEVTGVHHNRIENEKLLEYAAFAECASSHPISKSLKNAYGKPVNRDRVSDIEEISGEGILATVDGVKVAIGNHKLMHRLNVPHIDCHCVGTILHMALDGEYAGHIVISDVEKESSKEAILKLKSAGVRKTVMLTGDAAKVAEGVAASLGVDEVISDLLPAGKVGEVERIINDKTYDGKLAFVGDGINDAPVLTRADIGIAMGAMGSDAAIEAADVVLMDDDPLKISKAIRISRKCLRIVYENIAFALVVKFACLILGALGIANMWLAIFADVGVMIIAVLNAIRALKVNKL